MKVDPEIITSLPKIELHLHLDCSLSLDVVKKTASQYFGNGI